MAKRKKKITDFQEALLSNTASMKETHLVSNSEKIESERPVFHIEAELLEDFELLAKVTNTHPDELINQALSHFLRLKGLKLEAAKKKIAEEKKNEEGE